METAPKDGTVIIVYADFGSQAQAPIAVHAFYQKSEGHWSALDFDKPVPFFDDMLKDRATFLGWIEVPDGSPLAGKCAHRDDDLAREPGKLHLR